jgi:hypothetical protein
MPLGLERAIKLITFCFQVDSRAQEASIEKFSLVLSAVEDKVVEATNRALQKYMHEFHADRDHAMCNIQNRSIPAVQLTQLRKLCNKNFPGTGVLKSSQSCQVLQCKVAARQWRCLAGIVSFSGSCSRCLVLSPLPCPTLPK